MFNPNFWKISEVSNRPISCFDALSLLRNNALMLVSFNALTFPRSSSHRISNKRVRNKFSLQILRRFFVPFFTGAVLQWGRRSPGKQSVKKFCSELFVCIDNVHTTSICSVRHFLQRVKRGFVLIHKHAYYKSIMKNCYNRNVNKAVYIEPSKFLKSFMS